MYCQLNYKTKKALKEAIKNGEQVTVFAPGLGTPPENGTCSVEGPHYPKPHSWCASVVLKDSVIVSVR